MTREEVFSLIQAHLADELEVDPARIEDGTRFREDLEADSLDLYTLVQELEDSYGVKLSDEEAARIATVGQAVDFVGNVEGNEIPMGRADVIVTDGFTGNVVLKLMEGVSEAVHRGPGRPQQTIDDGPQGPRV